MKLPLIPLDKANHFAYGSVIFAIVFLLNASALSTFIAVLVIAVTKELYDMLNVESHKPEITDILFTVLGGIPPLLVSIT